MGADVTLIAFIAFTPTLVYTKIKKMSLANVYNPAVRRWGSASVVTQAWSYLGEVIFNLLVLVGLVKSADHIAKEMLGL